MNFAIEVPGEANPLSAQNVFRTLTAAASNNPQQIKSGAQQLQNWEKKPGYHSLLQTLFIDSSLPVEVRYLCIIQLKNGVDKYWRKAATNVLQKEEKDLIRSRCIECGTNEPDPRLALQNALMIAKIIRFEYPNDWPDAVSSIASNLRLVSISHMKTFRLNRALLILLEVTKELSTARIQRTRTSLQSAASEVLMVLGKIYIDRVSTWVTFFRHGSNDEGGAIDSVEQGLLAIRIIRRLLIAGWNFPNRSHEVRDIWSILRTHLDEMLGLTADKNSSSSLQINVRRLIEKHLRQIVKLHVDMAKTHPAGFALLPGSISHVTFTYWSVIDRLSNEYGTRTTTISATSIGRVENLDDEDTPIMEFVSLKGLLLLRACLKMVFNPAQTFRHQKSQDKDEKNQAREVIKESLLSQTFVETMMQTLVTRFFVFRPRDLRDWQEEPDEWERREEGEGDLWEFSIRSCSEKLFLDLMINYREVLVQPLLQVFYNVAKLQNQDVLLKDSIYGAIGLSAPVLDEKVDFDAFIRSTLVSEVQVHQPGYNILRRRIAIVLGQWLPVKEGLDRRLVYQIFQHLLDRSDALNDQVVRITAGRQLKKVIDPFEFQPEPFVPYVPAIVGHLINLINEIELTETKLAMLNTLTVIVTKLQTHICPFADQIMTFLPLFWDQAGEEYFIKQSILALLSELIAAMKSESRKYHSLIVPLIHNSVEADSATRVYLLEEAMDLWLAMLQQALYPCPPQIVTLAQHLFPMLDSASEVLRKAIEITETYIFLAPHEMLGSTNAILFPFAAQLNTLKREAVGGVLNIVDLLVRSALEIDDLKALTTLTSQLLNSRFLQTLLSGLQETFKHHQATGPRRNDTKATWVEILVETDYLSLLARYAVASPSLFLDVLKAGCPNEPLMDTIAWLLPEWFSHLDNISHSEKKKLNCLALTNLMQIGEPWIMNRLQELMTLWTELVLELYDEESKGDFLMYYDVETLKQEFESPAEERRRMDPSHRHDLKTFVRERLQQAIAASGGNEAFQNQWVINVDRDILQEFGKLGIL